MPFTKKRESIEIPWASRYVAEHYPDALVKLRCPLGPAPEWMVEQYGETEALARFRPSRPEVDAVVITPSKLILIEAKVFHWRTGADSCKTTRRRSRTRRSSGTFSTGRWRSIWSS